MPVLERPNIVFCVFDSLSMVSMGLNEKSSDLPVLSSLQQRSTLFTRVYTPCPESSPARASLFTGLDPCVHGLWTNGVLLPDNIQTFPQRMAAAGYNNYLVGRRQLAGVSQWTTEKMRPYEYSSTDWAHGPMHRSRQNSYLVWLQKNAPEHYSKTFSAQALPDNTGITSEQRAALEKLPENLSFNHWIGEYAVEWIASQPAQKPILVVTGFSVGSALGAEPLYDHDGEDTNRLALQQADAALGRILDALALSNRADDTIVVVSAGRGNNATAGLANALSEESIRVPLLIFRPGHMQRVESTPISTIDIAPTILELAGVPIGPRMQGVSLLRALDGDEKFRGWAMSRHRGTSSTGGQCWQTALCTENRKLISRHGSPTDSVPAVLTLIDLEAGSSESKNLAEDVCHEEELESMVDLMIDVRCALEDRTEPRIAEF